MLIGTTCFLDYLNWRFFRVIWLLPYLFRILRLYQIWNFHKIYVKTEESVIIDQNVSIRSSDVYNEKTRRIEAENRRRKCKSFLISEQNLITVFLLTMIPFLLLACAEPFLKSINIVLPVFSIQQCCGCDQVAYQNELYNAFIWYTVSEATYNMVFFASYFTLRDVETNFRITRELRITIICKFIIDFLYGASLLYLYDTAFVVLGFAEYF